jgi:hypothetical protein
MEELETKKITKIEFVKQFSFKFLFTFRHSVNGDIFFCNFSSVFRNYWKNN